MRALWGYADDSCAGHDMNLGAALDACFDQLRERKITSADLSGWIERMTLREFAGMARSVGSAFVEELRGGERTPGDFLSAPLPHEVYEAHAAAKQAAFANRFCDREAVHEWLALFLRAAAATVPQK